MRVKGGAELEIIAAPQGEITARMVVEEAAPDPEPSPAARVAEEPPPTAKKKSDGLQLDLFAVAV